MRPRLKAAENPHLRLADGGLRLLASMRPRLKAAENHKITGFVDLMRVMLQ